MKIKGLGHSLEMGEITLYILKMYLVRKVFFCQGSCFYVPFQVWKSGNKNFKEMTFFLWIIFK